MRSIKAENPASVLVVEDEPLLRVYFSDVLRQSGFDVIVATNGEDALAIAERHDVCAVVSDIAMPGPVNGFELARRMKNDSPHTGVILVSGVMEPPSYHLPRGVRFVTKPVKASTLLRLVREVADVRATLPDAKASPSREVPVMDRRDRARGFSAMAGHGPRRNGKSQA